MPTTKIKICGITNVSDALAAAELGADAIGLNFYSGSSRFIERKQAEEIVRELPPFVEPVGLFVNEPMDRVRKAMNKLGLRTFQWYGELACQFAKSSFAFNLDDYRKLFATFKIGRLGGFILKKMVAKDIIEELEMVKRRVLGIIDAMTEEERMSPEVIDSESRRRIAHASGIESSDVKAFLRQFEQIRTVMERKANTSVVQKLKAIMGMGKPAGKQDLFHPGAVIPMRAIPAFPVRDEQSLKTITACLASWKSTGQLPAAILVDAHVPGSFGGTGQVAPWQLLSDFSPGVPLILAGGLTPDNVAQAIRTVRPYGVDVASGVETSPGKKDADKMWRFIEQARSVEL